MPATAPSSTAVTPAAPPAPQEQRLPTAVKAAWGVGGVLDNVMANGIGNLALPIYNIALGVNPIWIGWAMAVPRIFDAIIDPLVGNISDNTRTRWGRRRPFIIAGAILSALCFFFVWAPPLALRGQELTLDLPLWLGGSVKVAHLFIYFFFSSLIYYFGYALFTITHGALGYELSMDYNERTRVMAWKSFFANGSNLILPAIPKLALLVPGWVQKLSGGTMGLVPESVKTEVIGIRYVGAAVAIILLVSGILPGLLCRERTEVQAQPKVKVWSSLRTTFAFPPFLILSGIIFSVLVGLMLVNPISTYINLYYVCKGDKGLAYWLVWLTGTLYAIMGVIVVPFISYLGIRFGKKTAMLIGQISVILSSLASWFLYNPNHPYWQILQPMLACPGLTCVWVLSGSMMADICDVDELKSGLRREGIFGAAFSLIFKAGIASVTVMAGYMLIWSGYTGDDKPQSEHTLFVMRLLFALVPALCLVVSSVLTAIFPINEKTARQVRAELDARKAAKAKI